MNVEKLLKITDLLSEANLLISELAVELTEQPFDLMDSGTWNLPHQVKQLAHLAESSTIICQELKKFTVLLVNTTEKSS